jgi:hypothetical protein
MTGDDVLVYLLWILLGLSGLLIGGAIEAIRHRRHLNHERVVRRLHRVTHVRCTGGHYVEPDLATWTDRGWACPAHELRRRTGR